MLLACIHGRFMLMHWFSATLERQAATNARATAGIGMTRTTACLLRVAHAQEEGEECESEFNKHTGSRTRVIAACLQRL